MRLIHPQSALAYSLLLVAQARAWGSSSSSGSDVSESDIALFGNSLGRDWMSGSTAMAIKLEGCMWGFVSSDDQNSGCLARSSSDGTTYWYQMANCRRAQAVYSIYASESSSNINCNSNTFKETVSQLSLLCIIMSVYHVCTCSNLELLFVYTF
jgi:hypothetical protein